MKMRWLAKYLLPKLQGIAESRDPDFTIVRGEDQEVYLKRWWLIPRNSYCNIYLHNMLGDDDAVMHDHMYASLSLILTDGLVEHYCADPRTDKSFVYDDSTGSYSHIKYEVRTRTLQEGQLAWRSSRMAHQLVVKSPAWTLFVTGPRIKEWGFWCPKGWKHFKDYVTVRDKVSHIGGGCGEG